MSVKPSVDCEKCEIVSKNANPRVEVFCPMNGELHAIDEDCSDFALLGLPERLDLTREEIDARFRESARAVHPDLFRQSDNSTRKRALEWTARLNEAVRRLKSPALRFEYFFQRRGIDISKDAERTENKGLLLEMLELQETFESTQDLSLLETMKVDLKHRIESDMRFLTDKSICFDQTSLEDIEAVKATLHRLRYLRRALEQIENKMERLEVL